MISIVGAGQLGQALASGFLEKGLAVRIGVREPSKHAGLANQLIGELRIEPSRLFVGTVEDAIAGADAVILATPYAAALNVAGSIPDWSKRILIDATNPIAPRLAGLLVGTSTSGAEEIAKRAFNARVVKAFNSTGAENARNPHYPGGGLFMPVAGDDAAARAKAIALATTLGFDAVDMGPLAAARYIEPMAMVWIEMAVRQGHGRRFGLVRSRAAA